MESQILSQERGTKKMKKIHLAKDFDGSVMCGEVNPAYVTIEIAKVTCTDCFNA